MLNLASAASLQLVARSLQGGVIINEHTLTREQTRLHVETLGRHFEFIGLKDLPSRLHSPKTKPFCVLTFDDGKRSNATVTAPELERLGVPAAFFVVSGFLGTKTPLWFDQFQALRKQLRTMPAGLDPAVLKRLPYRLLTERIDRACAENDVTVDLANEDICAMSWDQARDLRRRGFDIGAHGETHAIMTRETRSDAFENIATSIARVRAELGVPCGSFAFPNGNYTAELAMHAVRCGVNLVMTTEPTWVAPDAPLWCLPRVQLFGHQNCVQIQAKIALAAAGAFLANPDGTGRSYRSIRRLAKARSKSSPGSCPSNPQAAIEK